ncbi:hypothetical protein ENSA5_39460 [Enhygromyxa salina]|uniref:Uncharacterized protein n=1 Tax=Enhygromyxa salina TaxID=215803 RepID=A0A2S9XRN6_9BACT|nr:hypothetical protein [Enhygromyxa salina]PRP95361.1 hypothetical protein ENSA5_39460 [Enhygromyxa salina]
MSGEIFYIHVDARGCHGEVRLNDAPVLGLSLDFPVHAFPTISEWVVDGENLLSVHVEDSDESARLHVALCEAKIGDVPEPGNELELAVIEWPPTPTPTEPEVELPLPALPPVLSATGVAVQPWGEWGWQRSPPFADDASTITDVVAWVRDLHAALAAGQIDVLLAHSPTKYRELALAYEMSEAELEERLTRTWAHLSALPGWELAPFNEAELELRVRCDGQLVEPCTAAGEPVIRQARAINNERWSLPLFLARTNWEYTAGQLTIMR